MFSHGYKAGLVLALVLEHTCCKVEQKVSLDFFEQKQAKPPLSLVAGPCEVHIPNIFWVLRRVSLQPKTLNTRITSAKDVGYAYTPYILVQLQIEGRIKEV